MRLSQAITAAISLCSTASAQTGQSTKYYDATTGITYSSVTLPNGVTYRVALPVNSPTSDAIVQIVAPSKFGWCGIAWGGQMTNNPLTVAWPSGQSAIVSSRIAFSHNAIPPAYTGATYTYLKPTRTASEQWTVTARRQGCTRWSSSTGGDYNLDTKSQTTFAYACSGTAPTSPSSNSSTFMQHDQNGIWTHDLDMARNASFTQWVSGAAVANDEFVETRWNA